VRYVVDEVEMGEVFPSIFLFTPVRVIPPKFDTHFHVQVSVTRGTKERRLGILLKAVLFRKLRSIG
jgi:hypothetical protein